MLSTHLTCFTKHYICFFGRYQCKSFFFYCISLLITYRRNNQCSSTLINAYIKMKIVIFCTTSLCRFPFLCIYLINLIHFLLSFKIVYSYRMSKKLFSNKILYLYGTKYDKNLRFDRMRSEGNGDFANIKRGFKFKCQ